MGIGSGPKGSPVSAKASTLPIRPVQQQPSRVGPSRGSHAWDAARKDSRMQTFIVEATNRPGELARVAEVIAQRGINIEAFSIGHGTQGALAFMGHDEKGLKSALTAEGITYKEIPVVTIWLEDKPGAVAKTARRLADAGVNIEFLAPVEYKQDRRATVAIGVDNVNAARIALDDQLVDWMIPEPALAGSTVR